MKCWWYHKDRDDSSGAEIDMKIKVQYEKYGGGGTGMIDSLEVVNKLW